MLHMVRQKHSSLPFSDSNADSIFWGDLQKHQKHKQHKRAALLKTVPVYFRKDVSLVEKH